MYLGEERARRYPFVASQLVQELANLGLPEAPPMLYELSIESLLRLAGLSTQLARTLGLMPVKEETWRRLLDRYKESDDNRFRQFAELVHRYFGRNEVLLARCVPRELDVSRRSLRSQTDVGSGKMGWQSTGLFSSDACLRIFR